MSVLLLLLPRLRRPASMPIPLVPVRPCVVRVSFIAFLLTLASPSFLQADESTSSHVPEPLEPSREYTFANAQEFITNYCADCHQGSDAEAHLDLESISTEVIAADRKRWRTLLVRVRDLEMPPRDSEQPNVQSRDQFVLWLRETLHQSACGNGITSAPASTRRLNRNEYGNTVRDLLNIHVNVALTLPSDGAGGEGFDNAAETLFMSPIHVEKYLDAARAALNHAFKSKASRKLLKIRELKNNDTAETTAKQGLKIFLPRAFRRPVDSDELESYMVMFRQALTANGSAMEALQLTMTAAMISPHFLFRVESPNRSDEEHLLTDFELATRLSYFLWASMPDDELMSVAAKGKLQNDDELERQVVRMLGGGEVGRSTNKVSGFAKSFVEQWLGTRALGREFKPDPKVARGYNSELEGGMAYEPILFFEEILVKDLSLLRCIDADFTYANKSLARHYKIKGEFREQPRRVELPEGSHRGGFLGMASVLAVSSYPHRTSPVLRGKWILETMLGTPPPPPPPNVPELEEKSDGKKPTTLRERLEIHRQDATCASCHDRIDPLGFGLENYDVLGKWRTKHQGQPIDSRGKLPDGTEFRGPQELKKVLLNRKDQFTEHVTAKMLGFALGRGLRDEDYCAISEIVDEVKSNNYSSHALVLAIVRSKPFRYKAPSK